MSKVNAAREEKVESIMHDYINGAFRLDEALDEFEKVGEGRADAEEKLRDYWEQTHG